MPNYQYPFVRFRLANGALEHRAYTRLPLKVLNPATGLSNVVWGLTDTGADSTLFPATLALRLGHKLKGRGVKTSVTGGIEQTPVTAYKHTFQVTYLAFAGYATSSVD